MIKQRDVFDRVVWKKNVLGDMTSNKSPNEREDIHVEIRGKNFL